MSPQRAPAHTTMPHVIDPTLNVSALVEALEEKTKELAQAETRYQTDLRLVENRYRDDMRSAETRRIDQLASQKQLYDFKIADMLARSNEKALDLLANGNEKALGLLAKQFTDFKSDVMASLTDLQQKSWTAQGETKRGGVVWAAVGGLISMVIAGIAVAYTIAKGVQ